MAGGEKCFFFLLHTSPYWSPPPQRNINWYNLFWRVIWQNMSKLKVCLPMTYQFISRICPAQTLAKVPKNIVYTRIFTEIVLLEKQKCKSQHLTKKR